MSFANRITRHPIPFHVDRGREVLARFASLPAPLATLIEGTAGCSPYLSSLLERETAWISAAFDDPDAAISTLFDAIRQTPLDRLKPDLRIAKARIALLTALADLGGVWSLEQVTQTLTDFADLAVDTTIKALLAAEIKRGKLPGQTADDIASAGGMVVLAMGKGGAGELNYSSDIDLICLFDETRFDPEDYADARACFIRVTRKMCAMLSDITGDGYVFRTDLRLRPDPSATPVCIAMRAAEQYYESLGRTWERAAHIKARVCAGDMVAGAAYLERLLPFIWRKHLDFAAIQDAHDMRLRIREHKGLGGAIVLEGHNMKLGRGGIREIEFFTQTRQIIAGGRDPELRGRETVPALRALARKGWVPRDVAEILVKRYREHREIEHRLQMVNDAQTHDLPKSAAGFDNLARFCGQPDTAVLRAQLHAALDEVHNHTEVFFAPGQSRSRNRDALFDGAAEIIARWPGYPALRSARAVEIFERLQPEIMARMKKARNPAEALLQFDGFLAGLPAGVQLFSLFQANPHLIDLIVDICATSPALARHLSRNSQVLDAVLGGSFFEPWPGREALETALERVLDRVDDYENKLDAARRWMKEWHFGIGVHHLRGLVDAHGAGRQYADLAHAVVRVVWPRVVGMFSQKHGAPPGNGAMVLGMGSLGAGMLNAGSDLDLIVIYDADGVDASTGRRPLQARPYYARLTQALVTALGAPMAEGRLYEVDMRLRPSGRQGPVATSVQSFESYQKTEAWTWEHLALTRARAVAGPPALCQRIEEFRRGLLARNRDREQVLGDVADMRARLALAKPAGDIQDVKPGPGGLMEIELLAQTAALLAASPVLAVPEQLQAGAQTGWLLPGDVKTLTRAFDTYWRWRTGARLLSEAPLDMAQTGEGGRAFLLREMQADGIDGVHELLENARETAQMVIDRYLPAARKPALEQE
jgi:glutamate-ammonia-ligase adenylyltransferase